MQSHPLGGCEQTVNGRSNDPVRERDWVGRREKFSAHEFLCRDKSAVRLKPSQLGDVTQGGVVAEHRRRVRESAGDFINTGQATGDAAPDRLRRHESWVVACTDCVRDGHDEKRVSARLVQHGLDKRRADSVPRKRVAQ